MRNQEHAHEDKTTKSAKVGNLKNRDQKLNTAPPGKDDHLMHDHDHDHKAHSVSPANGKPIPPAQIKTAWEQIKDNAKEIWAKLTDDDFRKAEGSADKLYVLIHEKFGETKDVVKAKLDKMRVI